MISRRFVPAALLGILLFSAPAIAEGHHRHGHSPRFIDSVTLTPQGHGSLIAVTFAGRSRPRLLRSVEPIAAYAVADVDNDGDLDILATSVRRGLLLWRNAGRGHFVLAGLPAGGQPADVYEGLRRARRSDDGPVAADDRCDAAMPRAPDAGAPNPSAALLASAARFQPAAPSVRQSGRAPPSRAV